MVDITLTVDKEEVYEEVSRTTSYTGAKLEDTGDAGAYERIFTVDEDKIVLNRFWEECKNMVCNSFKKVLVSEEETEEGAYVLTLGLSSAFDESLTESMQRSLFSFFVMNITAKWYTFANKSEATVYATEAATYIEDIMRKAFYKKRPTRPTYDE